MLHFISVTAILFAQLCNVVSALVLSVGTGTFGRVALVRDRRTRCYYALKSMKIADVIRLKQEQHAHNEKEVLMEVNHPFLIRL